MLSKLRIIALILAAAVVSIAALSLAAQRAFPQQAPAATAAAPSPSSSPSPSPIVPPSKVYTPSELHHLQLEVKYKDAQLAQIQLQAAQKTFTDALQSLSSAAEQVKKEEGWPADVQFDENSLTFRAPVAPPHAQPPMPPAKEPKKP